MNDPAPPFGRGGWVCTALLLGLFAGGGITWAALGKRVVKIPVVLYQLPPAETAVSGKLVEAEPADRPAQALDANPDRVFSLGGDPRLVASVVRGPDEDPPSAVIEGGSLADRLRPPLVRLDDERVLHTHPKAGGCLANALAALAPFTKKGFHLRDDVWDGEISLEEGKAVSCQLFKGNEYCFCVGTDAKGAKLSLQLYGGDGAPADAEQSTKELTAGASAMACLRCPQTGTYFVVVKLEAATQDKVSWGMVSAYR